MSDLALLNAEALCADLRQQISLKEDELLRLHNDLARVELFISAWHSFSQNSIPKAEEFEPRGLHLKAAGADSHKRPKNRSKEEIGRMVASIIDARGQPVPRNYIYAALEDEGIKIKGTDPKMVLSTILWRLKSRFVRLKGYGYWFVDRDYEPADYKAPENFKYDGGR